MSLNIRSEDFIFRAPTPDDAAAVVDLINACSIAQGAADDFTLPALRGDWGDPGFTLATDAWVVAGPDGQLLGYEQIDLDPALWFLAIDREQIAGTALCLRRTESMGWIRGLGVRRPWRGRGLGMALLRHAFGAFYACGFRSAGLGVDAQSLTGATRVYERAGMHVTERYDTLEKIVVG